MTTSESKGRFFIKRIDSNRFAQRIESIRIANWNALLLSRFKHLSISSNVVLRQVFYCYTVYGDRFLQLFHELNLQFDCSIAAIQKTVFRHFNSLCDCV